MGGKRLKFPRRAKYKPYSKKEESETGPEVDEDEHKKRLELLQQLGLVGQQAKTESKD